MRTAGFGVPGRILSVTGRTVRTRLATGLLIVGLLGATPAEAQRLSCGGHPIHWVGGAPAASAAPAGADRGRSSGAPGAPLRSAARRRPATDHPRTGGHEPRTVGRARVRRLR